MRKKIKGNKLSLFPHLPYPLRKPPIKLVPVLRRGAKDLFPHLLAFHAEVDKLVGVMFPYPANYFPVHINPKGFQVAELPIWPGKKLPLKDGALGKPLADYGFEKSRIPESA